MLPEEGDSFIELMRMHIQDYVRSVRLRFLYARAWRRGETLIYKGAFGVESLISVTKRTRGTIERRARMLRKQEGETAIKSSKRVVARKRAVGKLHKGLWRTVRRKGSH